MREPLTPDKLADLGACASDIRGARKLGESIPQTWESIDRALALGSGLDLIWLGCRMADAGLRAAFVAFTIAQRRSALDELLGSPAPTSAQSLRSLAAGAWAEHEATGERDPRLLAAALRECARDRGLSEPAVHEAVSASLAALRVISNAARVDPDGSVFENARRAQIEWLAERLIGARPA